MTDRHIDNCNPFMKTEGRNAIQLSKLNLSYPRIPRRISWNPLCNEDHMLILYDDETRVMMKKYYWSPGSS